mmetsp:Transcript_34810/g.108279  ORF Transcript_34810/g.108279 Transcript_34810/m.108279 type:complete len:199 (-) Transcript_34810:467-1063(-)
MACLANPTRPAARSRLAAAAVVAALGVGTLGSTLLTAAFSPGSSVLDRVAAPTQRRTASRQTPESVLQPAEEPGLPASSSIRVDQNPQWASCFVQAQQESQAVLEEWVLRGEHSSLVAFRAWRQGGPEATAVRCVDVPEEEALRTVCLECASPGGAMPFGLGGAASIPGVVFGGMSQCMAHTAMGLGFCKSGQVSVAQ